LGRRNSPAEGPGVRIVGNALVIATGDELLSRFSRDLTVVNFRMGPVDSTVSIKTNPQ
jgi:hypothetical protein